MSTTYLHNGRRSIIVAFLHVCCWILLVIQELSFLYYYHGELEPFSHYFYFYLINIAYFYAFIRSANLAAKSSKHRWLSLLVYVIMISVIYLIVKAILDKLVYNVKFGELLDPVHLKKFLIINFARGSEFLMFAVLYCIASYLPYYRKMALENENAYLQQQINPHLLFNTLNHIYAEVYPFSQTAAESVQLLSEIERYSVDALGIDGKAPLADEIAQIKNLIQLHRFRYHYPLLLETIIDGEFSDLRIIPLSLLTLTENIFKHGNLQNPAIPALLHIRCNQEGKLWFHSRNLEKASPGFPHRTGIGLQNLKVRLDYRYPKRHKLVISNQSGIFELKLSISL